MSCGSGGSGDGGHLYEGEVPLDRKGPFGYTVRVLPRHAALPSPMALGLVVTAERPSGTILEAPPNR